MSPLTPPLSQLSDSDLFELLEQVSDEVKRRNGLLSPPTDQSNQSVEKSLKLFLESLSGLSSK